MCVRLRRWVLCDVGHVNGRCVVSGGLAEVAFCVLGEVGIWQAA